MSQYPEQDWSMAPGPPDPHEPLAPGRKAAIWMWVIGSVMLLVGGCCLASGLGLLVVPDSDYEQMMREQSQQMPAEQQQAFSAIRKEVIVTAMAACSMLSGVLPGLAMVGLGFPVRSGKRWAVGTSIGVVLLLMISLGVIFVLILLGSLISGAIVSNLLTLLVLGGLLATLGRLAWLLVELYRSEPGAATEAGAAYHDPWNEL